MLNFHKLEVFLNVVETGSFSKAGETLLMTQSAVSHHMRDLEVQLGTALFLRGPRGVTLTPPGELLRTYALKITALIAEAERAVTDVANIEGGGIHIGATPGVSAYLLPDCIVAFHAHFPNLAVAMQTDTSGNIIEQLKKERLDLGIIEGEVQGESVPLLRIQQLHQIEQMVIVGENHGWWERKTVGLAELSGQDFVMRQPSSQTRIWLDEQLAHYQITPRITSIFDNIESIKRSVVRGHGLAVMPAYAVHDALDQGTLHALSIEGQPLQRMLKLVWKEERPLSPPSSAFLKHVEEFLTPASRFEQGTRSNEGQRSV